MAGGVALGAAAAAIAAVAGRGGGLIAAPFAILWMLSPAVARWASRPPRLQGLKPLPAADAIALRLAARRTWRFFETFVTAEDHMLPPDNFQEDPKPVLAHRTSPTNLGLYLLSVVAAHDFGWLGTHTTVERIEATVETMTRLELFRGHFYNWYETRDLRPLEPKYVSSVDSGNLAGHLIAFGNACREMIERPIVGSSWRSGIEDSVALARESLPALAGDLRTSSVTPKQLDEALASLSAMLQPKPQTPAGVAAQLAETASQADSVIDIAQTLTTERGDSAGAGLLAWANAIRTCINSHQREVELLVPWAIAPFSETSPISKNAGENFPEDLFGSIFETIPSLGELPDRCAQALEILASYKAELAAKPDTTAESLAEIDLIAAALAHSSVAARALERRLRR